jgi:hypothetical protein
MVTWQFIHVCYCQVIVANHLLIMVANCQLSVLVVVCQGCCCSLLLLTADCIALHCIALHGCLLWLLTVGVVNLSVKILVVCPHLCQILKTASPKHFTIASAPIFVSVVSMFRTPRPTIYLVTLQDLPPPPTIHYYINSKMSRRILGWMDGPKII